MEISGVKDYPRFIDGTPSLMTMEPQLLKLMSHIVHEVEKNDAEVKKAFFDLIVKGFGGKPESDGSLSEEDIIERLKE